MAVDRLTQCDNIVALAKELGISRRLLYMWREQLEPVERGEGPPATSRESTLRHEVSRLKRGVGREGNALVLGRNLRFFPHFRLCEGYYSRSMEAV
jgi:transposase-like protein